MLARIRTTQEENASGFTLIEFLVVIIIIGILAAIAIPVFLNQRRKGVDAGVKSDLRQAAIRMESGFIDTQAYPTAVTIKKTTGNTFTGGLSVAGRAYCFSSWNAKGSHNSATNKYVYVSDRGGLQASTVLVCPAGYSTTAVTFP